MAALAALCTCLTAQAQGPVVSTDKDDYAPGETVHITVSGFQPLELLDFSIAVKDDNGLWIPDVAWADVPADASGGASAEYVVPETWLDKTLQLTVMGLTSGLVATTEFTDATSNIRFAASGLPLGTSVSVSWSGFNNGGNPVSGPTVFSAPGPSGTTGLGGGTQLTFAFPNPITVGPNTYDLISTSQASPFTMPDTGPPTPTTTITGTYQLHVPTNTAPVITPVTGNVDLGQIIGCLDDNNVLGTSVAVAYSAEAGADINHFNVYATFNGDTSIKLSSPRSTIRTGTCHLRISLRRQAATR